MQQTLVIATCVLLFSSPALARPAMLADHLPPAAEILGPGWVGWSYTLPTTDLTCPEARGWYSGPGGSRVVLLVSLPPADSLDGIWAAVAQRVDADALRSVLSSEHPSATTPPIADCSAPRRVQGLPASFPVVTEAITACRTSDAILQACVSGT